MKAAELYKVLRRELDGHLVGNGFHRLRCSRLAYQRPHGALYQTIWFRCDKWGWDRYAGSSFFVSFTLSSETEFEVGPGIRRHEGLNFFLTEAELETARALRDAIVSRIPPPPVGYFEALEEHFAKHSSDPAGLIAALRAQFEPEKIPYQRIHEFGLRYWDPEDVVGWAAFIAPGLPRATSEMDSWASNQRHRA